MLDGRRRPAGRSGLLRRPARSSPTCRPTARIAQEEIFGPVLAVLKASDLDDALRDRQRHRVRPDRRPLLAQPGEHRAGQARVPRRQPLHQPADHRRPGRPPAVRRLQALGHRHQGRRPRLPAGVPADPDHHREHHAPRLRARGPERSGDRGRGRHLKAENSRKTHHRGHSGHRA